ncbi:hypothetical protein ABIE56_000963 [Luteibacter sp. 621]|uniref:hypothetical protein n=1 Tax=Luteibacter sp. 621 TaxID=3373916 RepID=UPI003D22620D
MLEIPICPDAETGETRTLCYDSHGYTVVMAGKVVMQYRLEPICYQLGRHEREQIALIHGLQDSGELRMAEWVAHNGQIHSVSWAPFARQ